MSYQDDEASATSRVGSGCFRLLRRVVPKWWGKYKQQVERSTRTRLVVLLALVVKVSRIKAVVLSTTSRERHKNETGNIWTAALSSIRIMHQYNDSSEALGPYLVFVCFY